MVLTTIIITCLDGYSFELKLRNPSISNIKKRIYLHFNSIEPRLPDEVWEHEATHTCVRKKIPYKYQACFQILLLGNEVLNEDIVLNSGDILTLILNTLLFEKAVAHKSNEVEFLHYTYWSKKQNT